MNKKFLLKPWVILTALLATLSCDNDQEDVSDVIFSIEVTGAEGQNSLASGKTLQLTALFSSDKVSDEVTWSSENSEVAEVNATTGVVTGKQAGTVTITATSQEDSDITGSIDLTVVEITVEAAGEQDAILLEGTLQLTASFNPDDFPDGVIWSSNDEGIAEVDAATGVVTGKQVGAVTITATSQENSNITGSIELTVAKAIINVTGAEEQSSLALNGTLELTASFNPDDFPNEVTWSSGNPEIAEVDAATGVVTGKQAGTVTITATSQEDSNITGSIDLTVVEITVTGGEQVALNGTLELTASFTPDDFPDGVTWSSGNPEIAEVDATTGVVTGKQVGAVTITATSQENSNITGSIELTVVVGVTSVAITIEDEVDIKNGDCTEDCKNLETVTVEKALPNSHTDTNPSRLLKVTVSPQEAPNKDIDFTFEGTEGDASFEIVETDETTGEITLKITGVTAGETTLRATAKDGLGATDEIKIKVTQDHYVVTIQVGDDKSFTISPIINDDVLESIMTYNYKVDLDNDGIFDKKDLTGFTGTTLDFETSGTHTIRIAGTYPNPGLDADAEQNTSILSVDQWGTQIWESMAGSFVGHINLEVPATDIPNLSGGTKEGLPGETPIEIPGVLSMDSMFRGATKANPDVENWDVSKVEFMTGMFENATAAEPNVENWNTENVKFMDFMFSGATKANPDVEDWDVSKVEDMSGMFKGAIAADPKVSEWNISSLKVEELSPDFTLQPMRNMFKCSGLTTENYEGALNNFAGQVSGNEGLKGIDLGAVPVEAVDATAISAKETLTDPNGNAWTINDGNTEGCE